ncbi:kinesin-like protein KIN-1 isoform X1 [Prosopis cineraria]|uniref:kinesin-like protein KIN-1 isoform X1 n=1 Tax=Prosopis cineraria TaxID=364024 RepID=UPI00240F359D|nr:kinesin-like protein KIN-1 isoform X1 [Prosopis cineraria]
MSNITVCARFRPLSSNEKRIDDSSVCIRRIDTETFAFKDEKEEDFTFSFDRVFYEKSEQADVYEFLALPIVRDAVNAINGTVITYGQTGAGKTYSMEGPGILELDERKKGLLQRVVVGLFDSLNRSDEEDIKYSIKLSMAEIYMEKVRDLLDLSNDNIQIKESKTQGIILPGVAEKTVENPAEALQSLSRGIANRAVGETQMNMASSRSHCVYIFTILQEHTKQKRSKSGKVILVDLAGSEKVEKTGAEGRVLEEAKSINKSLSALGNVINALTCGLPGKVNHIPYRDSKLTRILQDALGGNSRTALLCCCSPSSLNAPETLSTLRFGARAKHVKTSPHVDCSEEKCIKDYCASRPLADESCARILTQLRERMNVDDVKLLEELFILEGIVFDPQSVEELESDYEDLTLQTISSLQAAMEQVRSTVVELKRENSILKAKLNATTKSDACKEVKNSVFTNMISGILAFFR